MSSSIGPQIPSHLSQQRRADDADTDSEQQEFGLDATASIGPQVPTHFLQTSRKSDNGDTDDEPGPSMPSASTNIGPQIPSRIAQVQRSTTPPYPLQAEDDDDDEDAYVPALPPSLAASRTSAPASTSKPQPSKRVLGPMLPGQAHERYGPDDDDSEDEYGPGPMPPPRGIQQGGQQGGEDSIGDAVREFMEREERRKKEVEEAAKPKALQRDAWMLVPPTSTSVLSSLSDPTKLKARQFNRSSNASNSRNAPSNLWTETPAERQKRIEDEVAGKKRRAVDAVNDADEVEAKVKRRRDDEVRRVVEEHTRTSRGQTLLDMHSSSQKSSKSKSDKDTEPPAIWDHSRDMSMGGRLMDEKQRSKMITDARSLGDRFGSGKSGGYL